ncbi:MAG: site-specific integrase [Oscillospiraceae bacterium]|nr:site-specific integrase [Oscillospiraceae bacterium]
MTGSISFCTQELKQTSRLSQSHPTGIRASSVRHIRMQDLNLRNNTLYLQHTKNNKLQILNVPPTLAEALKDYIADYRDDAEPTEYLFPNGQNKQLTKDALVLSFGRFCKKRGTTRTSLHQLRHYFGLNYILNGGDSFTLQTILGHSSQAITKKYVSLNHENIKPHFLMYNPLENIKKRSTRKQSITKSKK